MTLPWKPQGGGLTRSQVLALIRQNGGGGGGSTPAWDAVLGVGALSGGNNPELTLGDEFVGVRGTAATPGATQYGFRTGRAATYSAGGASAYRQIGTPIAPDTSGIVGRMIVSARGMGGADFGGSYGVQGFYLHVEYDLASGNTQAVYQLEGMASFVAGAPGHTRVSLVPTVGWVLEVNEGTIVQTQSVTATLDVEIGLA